MIELLKKPSGEESVKSLFQENGLKYDKSLNKESQSEITRWIKQEKIRIKSLPLIDIAFPCKVQDKEYLYKPIFVRARENSKRIFGDKFDVRNVELFWAVRTQPTKLNIDGVGTLTPSF